MIGSAMPFAKEVDWRPVRPPNALSRLALLNSAAAFTGRSEPPEASTVPPSMSAVTGLIEGALKITYPGSLAARLEIFAADEEDAVASDQPIYAGLAQPGLKLAAAPKREVGLASSERLLTEANRLLNEFASAVRAGNSDGLDISDSEAFAAGLPLDPEAYGAAPRAHMQALIRDFHRRQHQASVLVAACLATAFVLTIGGIVAIVSFAKPSQPVNAPASKHSTSVAWQRPKVDIAVAAPQFAVAIANPTGKGEPLLIPAKAEAGDTRPPMLKDAMLRESAGTSSAPNVILAQPGRRLALAPLLPPRQARYLLLKGLPSDAQLSAGHRSTNGAWMVKSEEVAELTLSVRPSPLRSWHAPSACSPRVTSPRPGSYSSTLPTAAKATQPMSSPAPSMEKSWPSLGQEAWTATGPARSAGTSGHLQPAMPGPPSA
jgi:hypothetical protein